MDDFKRSQMMREKAFAMGIATQYKYEVDDNLRSHFYDLNSGQFCGSVEPEKVRQLLQIAYYVAEEARYGDHIALLNLVALRSELQNKTVYWHRPYHVGYRKGDAKWVSLKDWLIENNQDLTGLI